jgi:hypothetical protein
VRVRRAALLGVVVAALVLALAAIALHGWYEREPPPLETSGPGMAVRLTTEVDGVPPPRYDVRLPDGTRTSLALAGISTDRGRPMCRVSVFPPGAAPRELALAEGQSGEAGGLSVTLVHVWRMPDRANNAVDVRVVPVPRGG